MFSRPRSKWRLQSVLSVRQRDWMVSLDLKDAYLQVPIHPDSHKFLRFVAFSKPYQFRALCFGLSTALQVFTRVMAPVSAFLHRLGIRIRRYLDDWLVQAPSWELVLQALETILHLCHDLEIIVNKNNSNLVPSQRVLYLGTVIDSYDFQGFSCPAESRKANIDQRRIPILQAAACVILADSVGNSLLPGPTRSGRLSQDVVPPTDPPLFLRSEGRLCSGPMGRSVLPGSLLVAGSGSPKGGCFSVPDLPKPRLQFRRFRRGLGCSLGQGGRFRPLVSRGSLPIHQC